MKKTLLLVVCCLPLLVSGCQSADSPAIKKAADQVSNNAVPTEKLDRVGH